jgi:hypothetical protein
MRVVTVYSALGKNTAMKRRVDQVVQLLFGFRQARGRLQRGDDGKVIAHLAVVEDALGRLARSCC